MGPLAACRAVLFAQLVDDPSSHPEQFPTAEAQEAERQRLFRLIEELVLWENVNNEQVLEAARVEIRKSAGPEGPPPLLDPFAGGGSIPLEAQRLGLEAHASDLNPVAVLINKALIEIPPKFANRPPVHPDQEQRLMEREWRGAAGLAEDVRYYGRWIRDEAEQRIGHLYPKVRVPAEHGGGEATVIAWLWARTVKCPNPACGARMPLVRSFWLSTKSKRPAWVEPLVDRGTTPPAVRFTVRTGKGQPPEGTVNRRGATCLCCNTPVPFGHVRAEGKAGRMAAQLMAIVAEGQGQRVYLPPAPDHEAAAGQAKPQNVPDTDLPEQALSFCVQLYGMTRHRDLFTPRQLVALTTFSNLVGEARARVLQDARAAGLPDDGAPLHAGGSGATAYADAVATYLSLGSSKAADYNSSLVLWSPSRDQAKATFARHALPMVWDFTEVNPFADAAGDLVITLHGICEVLERSIPSGVPGRTAIADATTIPIDSMLCISTDPPYYDNIGYADLSDYFYVWLRRSLGAVYPDLFSTLLVPKAPELVATPYRFGGDKERARHFFEQGLGQVFSRLRAAAHPAYPVTVYYAFKQAESEAGDDEDGEAAPAVASTGWETMLEGLVRAGFQVTGTWPMRTERGGRSISIGANALASSVVLVCRPRAEDAPLTTRRDFLNALKRELPAALKDLQRGNIAPVDLAQASIGPGMAVFSRYRRVLEADGSSMTVRTALALINQALDEYLSEQESEYDADTRWALAWFEQYSFKEAAYGDAETLSRAKDTSVAGMVQAGIVQARAGKVRLLRREELNPDWDPATDRRLTVWEVAQHLIRTLQDQGEPAAAALLARVGRLGEAARDLAYRLYTLCERKGWAQEALPYNGLVVAWGEVQRLGKDIGRAGPVQMDLGLE